VVTPLDGDGWQLRGCLGDEWRWHVGPDKPWDAPGWLPARVPGSVVDDLHRAGEVPDPYRGRNSLLLEWVPERAWVYRRRLDAGGRLRFEGVDHEATVFVDGEEAAHHEGAFTSFDLDVPDGEHLLAVVVHPAPASEPQVGRTSRVRVHKPRMSYGWDFCPRLVHQGIWRSVVLDPPHRPAPIVRLEDGVGTVEVHGEVVLRVDSPRLWWPNGMGEQHLYEAAGVRVGFRTLELDDDLTLVVNGEPTPIRGWNWCPLDALYGVPRPEKLRHLLELAARAHVNLLRVWGGGLIESDEFYDHCDRLGLLVWQEFSQSSSGTESVPSDDPAFVRLLEEDARAIAPRLRHHPSLALWGGGNELDGDDATPALAALREVVHELDPGRPWRATSPLGPDEVHGPWEHQGLREHAAHYDSRTHRLHSEFGVEGMTNRRTLERLVPEEERWPADRSNRVYEHLGAWWNNAPLVQSAFGGRIADVDTMRRASQWLQYEGLRYAVEANLRRGAGTIPWQLNESYPNAWCTAAVDHRGDPKPAYWGVARAYGPGHPSARFATWAWGGDEEARAVVAGPARFVDVDGAVVAEATGGELAAPVDAFASDVFLLDLVTNRYVMTRTHDLAPLLDLAPATLEVRHENGLLHLRHVRGPAAIGVVVEDARPYEGEGWLLLSDNVLDLLPGESRSLRVEGGGELLVEGWNVRAMHVR
jgi:beta-mannosidase